MNIFSHSYKTLLIKARVGDWSGQPIYDHQNISAHRRGGGRYSHVKFKRSHSCSQIQIQEMFLQS
jgi:hypothetical protein